MGLDLTELTSHFRERRGEMLPTATLRFERDPTLFAQLAADATPCLVDRLPDDLTVGVYEDAGLRYVATDRYDQPLTFTTPQDLRWLVLRTTRRRGTGRSSRSCWHFRLIPA